MAIKSLLILFTYRLLISLFVDGNSNGKRKLVQVMRLQTFLWEVPGLKLLRNTEKPEA
jgi:hypothetical protein